MALFHPQNHGLEGLDDASRAIMQKTIQFFEAKGKEALKADDHGCVWYQDFLDFNKENQIFATLLTPPQYAAGNPDARWDTYRNCVFNEILGFYGLSYWYAWQVTILGLGPIWMSANEELKHKTGQLLQEGGIFGFGLSEKEHGADLYSSDMMLTPMGDGAYRADGGKYYIGNGNQAALLSVFGKNSETDEYVFFAVETNHPNYEDVKNVVHSQMYVAELGLNGYPLTEADMLSTGQAAWDAALNTVNVGKFNLGWASIGICTHAFYEAITHAAHRNLYGRYVTDFPHIQRMLTDAYGRLAAMRLFSTRAIDYMRSANTDDRRYLLFNPMVKMKVTTQGEEVIDLLWDVIAARGFEKDTYFESAARHIRALPKLEGTVHVNMALVIKFMANYLFNPDDYPEPGDRVDGAHDDFMFQQGTTRGLGKTRFHDYMTAYDSIQSANTDIFKSQIEALKAMLVEHPPTPEQTKDMDFLLSLGELFTLIPYGQLIIEQHHKAEIAPDLIDCIFNILVRDFSGYALDLFERQSTTPDQGQACLNMICKPVHDPEAFERVWEEHVKSLVDAYKMKP